MIDSSAARAAARLGPGSEVARSRRERHFNAGEADFAPVLERKAAAVGNGTNLSGARGLEPAGGRRTAFRVRPLRGQENDAGHAGNPTKPCKSALPTSAHASAKRRNGAALRRCEHPSALSRGGLLWYAIRPRARHPDLPDGASTVRVGHSTRALLARRAARVGPLGVAAALLVALLHIIPVASAEVAAPRSPKKGDIVRVTDDQMHQLAS